MTLEEIARLCPAPEGMEWQTPGDGDFVLTTDLGGVVGDITRVEDAESSSWVSVECCDRDYCEFVTTSDAIPAAYARALAAVGLAPDPEKEALRREVEELRRRLTWASEVPTTPGRYLVEDPDADGAILMYEFGVGGLGWVEYVPHTVRFGPLGFASDSRFLLLANLKET